MFGSADTVPNLIRELIAPDIAKCDQALDELSELLVHQESIAPVSSYVIPFLIEIIQGHSNTDVAGVIDLLACFPGKFHSAVVERRIARAWHDAVAKGYALYTSYLGDSDPEVRIAASRILRLLKEHANETTRLLYASALSEPDDRAKAYLVSNLGRLIYESQTAENDFRATYVEMFNDLLRSDQHEFVRLAAALSAANLEQEQTPPEAEEILLEAILTPREFYPLQIQRGWEPVDSFFKIGVERSIPAFINALKNADDVHKTYDMFEILLVQAFNNGISIIRGVGFARTPEGTRTRDYQPVRKIDLNFHELSPEEKLVIRALAENDLFWEIQSNLLEIYCLPNSREELTHLLQTI